MSFYSFTSADSGAPTLTGQNGSLVTVLDWILVTKGGWAKPYSGTNKAIYRAATGNRFPLRVCHDSAVSGAANRATVRACESASGIDSVTDPVPTVAQIADSSCCWVVSNTTDATARPYWGVVSDTWLWLFIGFNGNLCQGAFYGDCPATASGDTYCTVIHVQNTVSSSAQFWTAPSGPGASPRWFFVRSYDGSVKASVAGVRPIDSGNSAFGSFSSTPTYHTYPHPIDSKLHVQKVAINCWGSNTTTSSSTKQLPGRAWLPNFYAPLHAQSIINSGDTFSDSGYNAGAVFRLFSSGSSGAAGNFCAVEITDTWSQP